MSDEKTTTPHHRQDNEQPLATRRGWRYHHVGVPTTEIRPDETHIEKLGMHVSGFSTSPFGIEWMRFDEDSPIDELIQRVPHVAFEVDDLDAAVVGLELIGEISSPSKGVRVAMIIDDGAPVELIEFSNKGPA